MHGMHEMDAHALGAMQFQPRLKNDYEWSNNDYDAPKIVFPKNVNRRACCGGWRQSVAAQY